MLILSYDKYSVYSLGVVFLVAVLVKICMIYSNLRDLLLGQQAVFVCILQEYQLAVMKDLYAELSAVIKNIVACPDDPLLVKHRIIVRREYYDTIAVSPVIPYAFALISVKPFGLTRNPEFFLQSRVDLFYDSFGGRV